LRVVGSSQDGVVTAGGESVAPGAIELLLVVVTLRRIGDMFAVRCGPPKLAGVVGRQGAPSA
jgi:long-subunit acyl-CoA synthetase (AMP-forming)